ncbi:porphobilinogen deaminase [Dimargaris cristalligena]|nr:porphobilinogen deaminase [Dimargaris cristalligena]
MTIRKQAAKPHRPATAATPSSQPGPKSPPLQIPIGSRKSALALVQTYHVRDCLQTRNPHTTFPLVTMSTQGDKVLDVALSKIGEKALFTKELEVALEAGEVDLVVHSLKDLPTTLPPGMEIGAMLEREDPRDAVVLKDHPDYTGRTLETLPRGSVVGTSSVRRIAQLSRRFPHLVFQDVRGNLNTRLQKLDDPAGPYAALILAVAGLRRLDWPHRISQILPEETMLHAVGQGALAIECRSNDQRTLDLVRPLIHSDTLLRCTAERTLMRELEGGCSVPLGVYTELAGSGPTRTLRLHALVASLDGSQVVEAEIIATIGTTQDPAAAANLGLEVAAIMKAKGAKKLLDSIRGPK